MEKKRGKIGPLTTKKFVFVKNAERTLGLIVFPAAKNTFNVDDKCNSAWSFTYRQR